MGLKSIIGSVLSFASATRNGAQTRDVKMDPGGGANVTGQHFAPPGDDSHPLPDDYALGVPAQGRGRYSVVGYVDPVNAGTAAPGEKRIYSRNAAGAVVAVVYLQADGGVLVENDAAALTLNADGSASIDNGSGGVALAASGDVTINGVIITAAGVLTVPSSITVGGKELADHTHAYTWTDAGGSGTTGVNN